MAISDDQLTQLKQWAYEYGRDGVLNDPSNHTIVSAVFDRAEIEDMRTEDEFNAIVTMEDLPAQQDWDDIVAEWDRGWEEYAKEHE